MSGTFGFLEAWGLFGFGMTLIRLDLRFQIGWVSGLGMSGVTSLISGCSDVGLLVRGNRIRGVDGCSGIGDLTAFAKLLDLDFLVLGLRDVSTDGSAHFGLEFVRNMTLNRK